MDRKSTLLCGVVLAFVCRTEPTGAQGVPVIDAAAIGHLIQQFEQMQEDYEAQIDQLTTLNDQLTAITGPRGMSDLLNSAADIGARAAADSPQDIVDGAISGGSVSGNTETINAVLADLRQTFDLEDLSALLESDIPQLRAVATQASTAMAAAATSADTYDRANEAMERVSDLIDEIDSTDDIKGSIDLNTRMLAEVVVLLNENLRLQATIANSMAADALSEARDIAAAREFGRVGNGEN